MDKKLMTLCFIYDEEKVLLGRIKKDGVLKNKYNGFGGKVEEGETIEDGAKRELLEESGINALSIKKRGEITFEFEPDGNPFAGKPIIELHIFSVKDFEGQPIETDEMKPEWFLYKDIPYDNMWPDDKFWLPLLLAGKNFKGTFYLKDSETITDYKLEEI